MQLKHNILKLYLLKGFLWFMLSMPIIILFFEDNDLSYTQIFILQSVYSLTLAILEIPSGYIADLFGRKNSLVVGSIFIFSGYLIFCSFIGFEMFLLAEVLIAIGGSLMSGADSAIMYDTLVELNRKDQYTRVEGKTYAIGNFSEGIAGFIGGTILASFSLLLPFQIQTAILFFCIPISISLIEPSININNRIEKGFSSILKVVRYSFYENVKLRWIIIYSSIIGVSSLSAAWLAQPFFIFIEVDLFYYGILWAFLNFTSGMGSFNSYKIEHNYSFERIMIILGTFMSFCFLFIYFIPNYFGIIFIFIIYFLRGVLTPIIKNQINMHAESKIRATVMSLRSGLLRIIFAIVAPFLGVIADHSGTINSFILLFIVTITLLFITIFNYMRLD